MRNKVFNVMSLYASWIIANYQAISKVNSTIPTLRLISQEQDKKSGEIYFVIQVVGKNIFPKLFVRDFKNLSLLDSFNKKDQEVIRQFLPHTSQHAVNSITARTYDRKRKQFIYTIEFLDHAKNIRKCMMTEKLSTVYKDIEKFDQADSFLIGFESSKEFN